MGCFPAQTLCGSMGHRIKFLFFAETFKAHSYQPPLLHLFSSTPVWAFYLPFRSDLSSSKLTIKTKQNKRTIFLYSSQMFLSLPLLLLYKTLTVLQSPFRIYILCDVFLSIPQSNVLLSSHPGMGFVLLGSHSPGTFFLSFPFCCFHQHDVILRARFSLAWEVTSAILNTVNSSRN